MITRFRSLALALSAAAILPAQLLAQSTRPYDGIQAGLDAYRLGEERRQTTASYQLNLNDNLRFRSGLPTSRGETIYYGYMSPVTSSYLYPGDSAYFPAGVLYPSYPLYYPLARQPIGQRQEQTGPNRWESHPVYNPPLTPYQPLPLVNSRLLDRTPYATISPSPRPLGEGQGEASSLVEKASPPPAPVHPAPARRGPREY